MALTESKYRTFDDLLDSVKIDLYTWDLEGLINPQQLIKVVLRVNYDLGVKIQRTLSRTIEIKDGKGKLPEGLDILNYALVCEDRLTNDIPTYNKTYSEGVLEGILLAQNFLEPSFVNQSTVLTDVNPGMNVLYHGLHSLNIIVQAFNTDGSLLDFDVFIIDNDNIRITSDAVDIIPNVKFVIMGAKISTVGTGSGSCPALLDCASDGTPRVYYTNMGRRYESKRPIPLQITKTDSLSPEKRRKFGDVDFDTNYAYGLSKIRSNYYEAYIKNGFLHVNFDEGVVFLNYQSIMEDDNGDLLVLDHPYCNEYYEYALKQRIYENLFMAGEPVQNHLSLMSQQLRAARNQALGFVNTPDFQEMKKLWEMNRKAQYHNYYNMFKNYII